MRRLWQVPHHGKIFSPKRVSYQPRNEATLERWRQWLQSRGRRGRRQRYDEFGSWESELDERLPGSGRATSGRVYRRWRELSRESRTGRSDHAYSSHTMTDTTTIIIALLQWFIDKHYNEQPPRSKQREDHHHHHHHQSAIYLLTNSIR